MANSIVWVDIPVLNLDRSIKSYSAVIAARWRNEVSGCLFTSPDVKPSDQGPLFYLNAQGRLDPAVAAVESNGEKVLQPKHAIGPHGFRAVILDSEGNRVALHSM
jgi:predicted enzyme related to lactoylglutathione lyase